MFTLKIPDGARTETVKVGWLDDLKTWERVLARLGCNWNWRTALLAEDGFSGYVLTFWHV
jgi:hypothetical protein